MYNSLETIEYMENWIHPVIFYDKYYTIYFWIGYLDDWIQDNYRRIKMIGSTILLDKWMIISKLLDICTHEQFLDLKLFGYLDD